jgi:hypothetical protein
MVSPTPANELAQLLEDEQIENTTGSHLVIVIVRDAVPVETLEGLGEGHDERDREGVGVAKHLLNKTQRVSLYPLQLQPMI